MGGLRRRVRGNETLSAAIRHCLAICLLLMMSAGAQAQWTDGNGVTFTFVSGSAGNNNEGPENVCDGQTNTKFCATGLPCYVVVEASLPVRLTGYSLYTAGDTQNYPGRNPRSWTIEGSMDGETWTQFVSETDNTTMGAANNREYTFTCNSVNYYKYFRLTISKLQSGTLFQFSEFHPTGRVDTSSYVFISNETNGYFLNSSAQATQTFTEGTCVWKAGAALYNTSTTLSIGTTYLRGYNSNGANSARTGNSGSSYIQRWRSVGGYLVHYNSANRYVYRDASNQAAWNNNANIPSNAFRVYTCTKIAGGIDGSITGADYIATTGTSEGYERAASYTPEYYKFYGPDTRYYADGYEGATTTKPSGATTGITYSNWTLEGADGYATVNSTTGVVTYNNLVPEGSRIVTLKCTATHTSSGKSAVLTKEIALINENIPTRIYLDPSKQYGGNDSNPGTKDKPVLTWKRAYSLLNKYGTVYSNYIILMSEYVYNINDDQGLASFQNDLSYNTYEKWKTQVDNVGMNVPATITSYLHDNDGKAVSGEIDYTSTGSAPARYNLGTSQHFLFICADTRFEWLSFYGHAGSYEIFFAQYFNVEFGHGLKMSHFKNGETYGVLCQDSYAADFQIFGGMNNDTRFKSDPRGFEEHLPHAKDGFKMIFRSGHFSNVCAGGRQANDQTNGVFGTPRQPIKAQIIVDIDRTWNDTCKQCITSAQGTANSNRSANYDIGMLLAGNHEGCMYGDVDLMVLSGYVARVVNGILGARRAIACNVGGGNYPYNAYMGRANALMDPSKMADAHGNIVPRTTSYSDETAYITELYGGGLGRPLSSQGLLNLPVYGKNTVTINGGTIGIVPAEIESNKEGGLNTVLPAVFGGASGGVNGIGDDASRAQKLASDLTNEERLPYWYDANGQVAYTDYTTWKTKDHVQVHCYNTATDDYTDIDLQYASTQVTINGGTFGTAERPIDGIYGGGSGYINGYIYPAATNESFPFSDAGTLYGKPGEVASNLTINGGTFYCNIYGAGRGTDEYYSKQMQDATKCSRYTALAKVYGDVQVNINGGTIYGNVYGGGAGFAELKLYNKTTYGQMTDMARLTGNSTVNIGGNATITSFTYNGQTLGGNVYGGGMLAGVTGASNVNVAGTATVTGDVYAAAQGIPAVRSNTAQTMPGTTKTYILNTAANATLFGIVSGNTTATINGGTVGGNIFGGAEAARCGTNTSNTATVNIKSAVAPLNDVYGGGELGDVQGNTAVNLLGGTVHDVYGGGLGSNTVAALVQGNATVTLNGGAVTGNIFGANNLNGTPKGHVLVDVKATEAKGTESTEHPYHVAGVYGGGNLAAYVPTGTTDYSEVVIEGCENSIEDVFGGGNAAAVPATLVTVWGGDIRRVFAGGNGSSAPADVTNSTQAVIHGGTIKEVYGGSNTQGTIGGDLIVSVAEAQMSGEDLCPVNITDLYGGGNKAPSKPGTIEVGCCTRIANVYGGSNDADITGNIDLKIKAGNIGNVFGGNNTGHAVKGSINVDVNWDNTTYDCDKSIQNVYGGGNMAAYSIYGYNDDGTIKTSGDKLYNDPKVNILNGTVTGNVFGGGLGSTAAVTGNPVVNINGENAVAGSVFGGGQEANVAGNTTVTVTKGIVTSEVYGGGALADISGNTAVTLAGGSVKDVYGGGLGRNASGTEGSSDYLPAVAASVGGNTTVTLGGSIVTGSVFGANNVNGTPLGTVNVIVNKTMPQVGAGTDDYDVAAVYGGGNQAAYVPDESIVATAAATVTVNGCDNSIEYVYGGGNAAPVPATNVTIWGGDFEYIFAGGNGAGEGNPGANVGVTTDGETEFGSGNATVNFYGGNVNHLFGGSNTKGDIVGKATVNIDELDKEGSNCPVEYVGEAYAAGNEAYMEGNAEMNIGCVDYEFPVIYGGAKKADVGQDIVLNITSGKYQQVFGGNNLGGKILGSITVNVDETGCHPVVIGELYGGGNMAPYSIYGYNDDGTVKDDGTKLYADPVVNIISCTSIGAVYGGGYGTSATVVGNPTVNINQIPGKHAALIDADADGDEDENADAIGTVGDVFGGGNAAPVQGNTFVNIGTEKGTLKHVVGDDDDDIMDLEFDESSANIRGNVYGGGNKAVVTGNTKMTIGPEKTEEP